MGYIPVFNHAVSQANAVITRVQLAREVSMGALHSLSLSRGKEEDSERVESSRRTRITAITTNPKP